MRTLRKQPTRADKRSYEAYSTYTVGLGVPDRCRYRRTPPPTATIDRSSAPDGRRCESQLSSVSLADATRGSDRSNGMPSSTLRTTRRPLCLRRGPSQTRSMLTEKDDRWSPLTIPSWSKTVGILVQRIV